MNIPQILASDTEILIYRKKLNLITKKVTSTILLHQMIYWYTKMGGSFYKFIEPCKNKAYSEGDSWCEELGFSRKEFSTAYKILEKLGVVTKKIDINRVTTYYVKIEVISKLLSGVYGAAESGITQMPKGDLDTTDTTSEITQIFEDEEEDKQIIPIALADLAPEELEAAIKKCVTKNAKKSRSGYRKALLKGLSEGDVGWISEVLEFVDKSSEAPWVREKRLKREQGEKLSANLQAAGFSNIFDYLEHPEEMR